MSKPGVLITSIGAKVAMIQAVTAGFRKLDDGAVIYGADSDSDCIGQHFVSGFWHMPLMNQLTIDDLLDYCKTNGITHIIPSRDGELAFFARHRKQLNEFGVMVMVSDDEAIEVALDKFLFAETLITELPVIPTFLGIQSEAGHWVVKERYGAGSQKAAIDVDFKDATSIAQSLDSPVFQPYISGEEYSVDIYISADHECLGYVVRSRDLVESGESVKTTSRIKPEIGVLAVEVCQRLNLTGHCLVQIIQDITGANYVIEVNPRYGGASGLSVSLGLDSFYWFACESTGQSVHSYGLDDYPANKQLIKFKQERVVNNDN